MISFALFWRCILQRCVGKFVLVQAISMQRGTKYANVFVQLCVCVRARAKMMSKNTPVTGLAGKGLAARLARARAQAHLLPLTCACVRVGSQERVDASRRRLASQQVSLNRRILLARNKTLYFRLHPPLDSRELTTMETKAARAEAESQRTLVAHNGRPAGWQATRRD